MILIYLKISINWSRTRAQNCILNGSHISSDYTLIGSEFPKKNKTVGSRVVELYEQGRQGGVLNEPSQVEWPL